MGVYRMYTGEDGETHIDELPEDAIKEIQLEGAKMEFSVSQREPGLLFRLSPGAAPPLAGRHRGPHDHRP